MAIETFFNRCRPSVFRPTSFEPFYDRPRLTLFLADIAKVIFSWCWLGLFSFNVNPCNFQPTSTKTIFIWCQLRLFSIDIEWDYFWLMLIEIIFCWRWMRLFSTHIDQDYFLLMTTEASFDRCRTCYFCSMLRLIFFLPKLIEGFLSTSTYVSLWLGLKKIKRDLFNKNCKKEKRVWKLRWEGMIGLFFPWNFYLEFNGPKALSIQLLAR